ncbi:MAG: AAA family ATPase, partial [Eubacterium sp.]|nr:AAA family ATPase [Eubacterium sp.]
MHDPDILILDEPTSGLDPLMQNRFIKLIAEEKKKGKTILLSSHMFEEAERTCDRLRYHNSVSVTVHCENKRCKPLSFICAFPCVRGDTASA